jgi:hypothetical protein
MILPRKVSMPLMSGMEGTCSGPEASTQKRADHVSPPAVLSVQRPWFSSNTALTTSCPQRICGPMRNLRITSRMYCLISAAFA